MKLGVGFFQGEGDTRIPGDPLDEIINAPDRAAAIVITSVCEKRLEQALKANFCDDPNTLNALLQPDGPVGNFGAKANLAFALSLISAEAKFDLNIIVKVRNWFAHDFEIRDFRAPRITAVCAKLRLPELYHLEIGEPNKRSSGVTSYGENVAENLADPRTRFIVSALAIANGIGMAQPHLRIKPAGSPYV